MVKYGKLFLGSLLNIFFGLVGVITWVIMQENTYLPVDLIGWATFVFAVAFVPAFVLYIVWYFMCLKADASASGKRPSWLPFFVIGVVALCAIALLCGLIFFLEAYISAIITVVAVIVGSLLSYIVGQPK